MAVGPMALRRTSTQCTGRRVGAGGDRRRRSIGTDSDLSTDESLFSSTSRRAPRVDGQVERRPGRLPDLVVLGAVLGQDEAYPAAIAKQQDGRQSQGDLIDRARYGEQTHQ